MKATAIRYFKTDDTKARPQVIAARATFGAMLETLAERPYSTIIAVRCDGAAGFSNNGVDAVEIVAGIKRVADVSALHGFFCEWISWRLHARSAISAGEMTLSGFVVNAS